MVSLGFLVDHSIEYEEHKLIWFIRRSFLLTLQKYGILNLCQAKGTLGSVLDTPRPEIFRYPAALSRSIRLNSWKSHNHMIRIIVKIRYVGEGLYVYAYVYVGVRVHVCTHACVYMYICLCVYMYTCTCVYVCMNICVCMSIYAYRCTLI